MIAVPLFAVTSESSPGNMQILRQVCDLVQGKNIAHALQVDDPIRFCGKTHTAKLVMEMRFEDNQLAIVPWAEWPFYAQNCCMEVVAFADTSDGQGPE